jgi:16S rRNA pseudouridine516 synthase
VHTQDEIDPACVEVFARGLYFQYENLTTRPAILELLAPRHARLTLFEGRYHQVKRMFGHFQNKVIGLHRVSMGTIQLAERLCPGQNREVGALEIASF